MQLRDRQIVKIGENRLNNLFAFALMMLVALSFLHSEGSIDVIAWLDNLWMAHFEQFGFIEGYKKVNDSYPPLSFLIIGTIGILSKLFAVSKLLIFKMTLFIFFALTVGLYYGFTRNIKLTLFLYLTTVINTMIMAYLDILYAPFLLGAFFALYKEKYSIFSILYMTASLIKFQPLIIAPFLFLYIIKITKVNDIKHIDFKKIGQTIVLPAGIVCIALLAVYGGHVFKAIKVASKDSFLSGNALNFNWIYTFILYKIYPHDFNQFGGLQNGVINVIETNSLYIRLLPRILFYGAYGCLLIKYFRTKKTFNNLLLFAVFGYITYFIFNTGVHENHLFLIVILIGFLLYFEKTQLTFGLLWIMLFNINMVVFYGLGRILPFSRVIGGVDITLLIAIFALLYYIYNFIHMIRYDVD